MATLTFSIVEGNLFIGGLQGLGREYTDPEILKQVTKGFYGLFPKRLLMEIFYALFPEKKIAVGNTSHIYLAARYKHQEKEKFMRIMMNSGRVWEQKREKRKLCGVYRNNLFERPWKKFQVKRDRSIEIDMLSWMRYKFLYQSF